MFMQITAVLTIIIFLGIIFAVCGDWLYCKAVPEGCSRPVSFRIGTGYFLGMALFETLWKVMAYISGNAKITLAVILLAMIFIALIKLKSSVPFFIAYFGSIDIRKITKIVLIIFFIVLVYVLEVFLRVYPFPNEKLSVLGYLGSSFSVRYANIATFILESNSIPVLSQNYGQSILAAVPLLLDFNSPYLALNLWLSTSHIFLYIIFYGFFVMLGLNNLMSLAGSFLLMAGNTALSLFPIAVMDSGNPLFLNGYTDTIFSAGSFLGFLILLKYFYDDKIKSMLYFSIAAAVLCVSWSFTAPQNIILSAVLVTIISGIMLSKKRFSRKHKLLFVLMMVFVLTGITQGGIMTPKQLRDNVEILGVMKLDRNYQAKSTHAILEFPYFHLYKGNWVYGMFDEKREMYKSIEEYRENLSMPAKYSVYDMYYEMWYEIEADFFNSLRIIFFPLLGLILPWFISGFREISPGGELSDMKKLWFASLLVFLLGYCIAFCGEFPGYKWELSRFLIPGYIIAPMSFIVSMNILLKQISQRKSWLVVFVVMFIMTFGQISFMINQIEINVFNSGNEQTLPFNKRFKMLVYLHGMQGLRESITVLE